MEGAAETGALVAAELLDDLGIQRPPALVRLVDAKIARGHACYHGDRQRLSWQRRARRLSTSLPEAAIAAR